MFLSCPILSCQRRTTYSDDTDKRIAAESMVVAETSSENPTVAIHRGFHMIIFCTPHSNIRRRRRRGIPRRVCSNQIVRKEHGEI